MKYLRRLDIFPKIREEVVKAQQTKTGGFIFLLIFCLLSFLVFTEFNAFLFGKNMTTPFINKSNDHERIRVNMNMSFFQIPCSAISLDYQDVTGSHFEDIKQTVFKIRLRSDGSVIHERKIKEIRKVHRDKLFPSNPVLKMLGL